MVDKTETEFTSLEDTVSGDIYIGGGETRAIKPVQRSCGIYRKLIPASTTTCTAGTPKT